MQIISHSPAQTLSLGKKIAKKLKNKDIICLFGDLGSGKTVLTQGIAEGLGIKRREVISPSFTIMRLYSRSRYPLYHFDFYRLKIAQDILDLGYEEYFYGDAISVIEWADRLKFLLPQEYLKVELFFKDKTERRIKLSAKGSRYQKMLKQIL